MLQEITDKDWIDGEYLWIYQNNPDIRLKYKKTKTAHMASQWFPTVGIDRLIPACRFMLWTLYNDDTCEEGTLEEIQEIGERTIAVLRGEMTPENAAIPLGSLLASLKEELAQFLPQESLYRFIDGLCKYFKGLRQEIAWKTLKCFPSIEECIAVREESLCLYPFLELQELETGLTLPAFIYEHPVIQRLRALASRIILCFNDVQSVLKDEATDSVYYNVVKVIQHHRNISLEEACLEDLRIHNEAIREFAYLQSFLPDFGEWQEAVINRVHYMSMTPSGWKSISRNLERYNTAEGFPAAEAVKEKISAIRL